MNKIIKIVRILHRNLILLLEPFSTSLYMKCYLTFLKKNGMNIIGNPRYIAPSVHFDGIDYSLICIGDSVVVSKNVEFLTHDFSIARGLQLIHKKIAKAGRDEYFLKPIIVGNNCFIGLNSIIMPGSIIGDNVIIGSGSVVRGAIPNGKIVIGNPAQIIGNTYEWSLRKYEEGNINCE